MVDFFYELRHDYCAGTLHIARVTRTHTQYWFIGNRKLTKEEGEEDSSVVVKHQEDYAIEIYGNTSITVVYFNILSFNFTLVSFAYYFFPLLSFLSFILFF